MAPLLNKEFIIHPGFVKTPLSDRNDFPMPMQVNGKMENGSARFTRWVLGLAYRFQRNSVTGSKRNIAAHYDIGNDLFATFLDQRHWMYSSAVFPYPEASLEEASTYKLDLMLEKLDVQPEHHLLEIGTGWGGLAIHAAKTRGCRVTTTISEEQHAYTARRIQEEGLEDRITLLKQDYRELTGRLDRLISVEMISWPLPPKAAVPSAAPAQRQRVVWQNRTLAPRCSPP